MKLKLVIFVLIISFISNAQEGNFEKPDFKKIKKNIKKNSNLNYDSLLKRYRNADSTMSIEEKRHLYYGYSFHKNYSPYGISKHSDSIREIVKKETLNDLDFQKLIRFADSVLVTRPFDTDALNMQLFAFDELKDTTNLEKKLTQVQIIFDALFSSGDAITKESAIYVLYTSHEYDILRIIGYEFMSQSLIGSCDYMSVRENENGYDGFYFNISTLFESMAKQFKND